MRKSLNFLNGKIRNTDIRFRKFNFSFCLKLLILMVLAGVFFDNPANSINFSIYPLTEAVRLNLRPPVIMLGGIILGPIWGALIGGFVDTISFFLWHNDMNYIFTFTLLTMLRGFLAGYIYNYLFKKFNLKAIITSIALPHILISGFLIPFSLYYYYNVPLFNNMRIRLLIQILTIPLFTLIYYFILNGMRRTTELKELHTKMEKMLKKDDLTGLSNRRHFMEFLHKMLTLSKRHSHSLSLLMADIDKFKQINDNYGHNKGDEYLKTVGKILKKQTRNEDLAARMGGDEFVVLLPETNINGALIIANRIKEKISELNILTGKDDYTVSIGVTELEEEDDVKSFLKRADDALYSAKENGRNKVEKKETTPITQELEFT